MAFVPIYSKGISDAKIRLIFCRARFNNRISCSRCGSYRIKRYTNRQFRCQSCWTKLSITFGTWLDRTRWPLRFWYEMAWCLVLSHAAYKAHQLLKTRNDSSCWLAYQTIRKAMTADSLANRPRFFGTCEVDESYFGGQFKNLRKSVRTAFRASGLAKKGRGAKSRKQPVFGVYKRNGQVYLELVPNTTKKQLTPRIKKTVEPGSQVNSDDHQGYAELVGLGYIHRVVHHGQEEYVVGDVHINSLEGFWGLSKTNMHTYKGIRKPNWIYYLKEMEWRYNHRQLDFEQQVLAIIKLLMSDKISLSYRKETSRPS